MAVAVLYNVAILVGHSHAVGSLRRGVHWGAGKALALKHTALSKA